MMLKSWQWHDIRGRPHHGTRAQLLSRPRRTAPMRPARSAGRASRLRRDRHVRVGNEPSIRGVSRHHRGRGGHLAPPARHPAFLPCAVPARRCDPAVCGHPVEPHAPGTSRIRGERQFCQTRLARRVQIRGRRGACEQRGHELRPHPRARRGRESRGIG